MEKEEKKARLYRVNGRVQGVGYRNFAEWVARGLRLEGYVRNLRNGSVEVYAVGRAEDLIELESSLWKGPRWAEVRGVDWMEASLHESGERGFHTRH